MNSHSENIKTHSKSLSIPQPDPANISVLSENLPKSPILPWNNFDSPWLDHTEDSTDEPRKEDDPDENTVFSFTEQSNSSLACESNDESTEEQPQNHLSDNT